MIIVVVLVSVIVAWFARKPLSEARAGLIPIALRVLFLAYPIVTNVAFDGFSCLALDDGDGTSRWLAADLSIRCDTALFHKRLWNACTNINFIFFVIREKAAL